MVSSRLDPGTTGAGRARIGTEGSVAATDQASRDASVIRRYEVGCAR